VIGMPTEKQYRLLLMLGNGCALVVARKRETEPLLRRGWVTGELKTDGAGPYYSWVRISPDGLRALALAVERYGLPYIGPKTEVPA